MKPRIWGVLLLFIGCQTAPVLSTETHTLTFVIEETARSAADDAQRFIARIEAELDQLGLAVEFVQIEGETEEPDEYVDAQITFASLADHKTSVVLNPLSEPLSTISPLLVDARPVTFSIRDPNADARTVALLLYVLDRCDLAMPRLAELPHDQDIAFLMGNCQLADGNLEQAIAHYDPDGLHDDTGAFVGENLVWAQIQLGEEAEALAILNHAINDYRTWATGEEISKLLTFRAKIHALTFRYDDALADMDAAIALDSDNPEHYVERGKIVMLLYEWDRVLQNYNAALALDSEYADAYYYRGVLYYSILEREQALADFEHYLNLAPRGLFAERAQHYTDSIRIELKALGS